MHRDARRQPQMVLESIGTSGAPEPSSDLDEPRFLDPPDGSSSAVPRICAKERAALSHRRHGSCLAAYQLLRILSSMHRLMDPVSFLWGYIGPDTSRFTDICVRIYRAALTGSKVPINKVLASTREGKFHCCA